MLAFLAQSAELSPAPAASSEVVREMPAAGVPTGSLTDRQAGTPNTCYTYMELLCFALVDVRGIYSMSGSVPDKDTR